MIRYLFLVVLFIVLLVVPASGMKAQLFAFPGETVAAAADKLRNREFKAALKLCESTPPSGARDFVAGIAAFKSSDWEPAARSLEAAARSFPLLADYALYFQAVALDNLKKPDEALQPLLTLQKLHRESPVHRPSSLLIADIHYNRRNYPAAVTAYQKFIESYPAGSDALSAQHRMALCREASGDPAAAAKILRNLWLANPASPLSAKAEEDLKRLVTAGAQVAPYTADELFKRGITLFDLKKFSQALTAFRSVPREGQTRTFLVRLDLKTAQSLYRLRKYGEAEKIFERIAAAESDAPLAAEATFWLARCKDKKDHHGDALLTFMQVTERWPNAAEADNALLEAAYIRKSQQEWQEVGKLLNRLLSGYPDTALKAVALWEAGWSAYKAGDKNTAAQHFAKLAATGENRDRALYWLARSRAEAGDRITADAAYASLVKEFPLSYYALAFRQKQTPAEAGATGTSASLLPQLSKEMVESLPLPANNERIRALIACGLTSEAKKELWRQKPKQSDHAKLLGLARLYLEMDDYNGAFNLFKREPTRLNAKEGRQTLSLQFPLPFMTTVSGYSSTHSLPMPLLYAVMRAESSFSPSALSPVGAVGLMQLMPATAAQIEGSGKGSISNDMLSQPDRNIRYGSRHMKDLLTQYNGDLIPVIASYNAGATAVNRWRRAFGALPSTEFIEQIPYGETREYVKQVIASTAIYSQLYGFPLNGMKLPLPAQP